MATTFLDFQRILVATDFSPPATAALRQAIWLARQSRAEISLAHAIPDPSQLLQTASSQARLEMLYGDIGAHQRALRQKSDERLKQVIAELGADDLKIRFETLLGEPFVALTHAVQAEVHDLVLAGSHGLARWERMLVGSTARKLIRKCPASVWIVPADHVEQPRVVLAATDFSEVSWKAAAQGLWLAQKADAQLHLLHVIDARDTPEDLLAFAPQDNSLRAEINREASERMNAFVSSLTGDQSRIQIHLSWGSAWQEIQRLAARLSADLVAMGTVGRSGIKGVLLGNTAERVMSAGDVSLLTVKPNGFVSPIQPAAWPLSQGRQPTT